MFQIYNPWHGCTNVNPICKHCYMFRMDEEYGKDYVKDMVDIGKVLQSHCYTIFFMFGFIYSCEKLS